MFKYFDVTDISDCRLGKIRKMCRFHHAKCIWNISKASYPMKSAMEHFMFFNRYLFLPMYSKFLFTISFEVNLIISIRKSFSATRMESHAEETFFYYKHDKLIDNTSNHLGL